MNISRILVATDFSAPAEAAFSFALDLADKLGATVHLVHVVENPLAAGVWSSEVYTAEIANLQVNLVRDAEKRLQSMVPATGPQVTTEVRTGPIAAQVLAAAAERHADLIVMGTHGRTGLAHVLLGSVAERVVRLSPCPVLTMRGSNEPPAAA